MSVLSRRPRMLAAGALAAGGLALAGCGASHPAAPTGARYPTGSATLGAMHVTGAYIPAPASPDVAAAYFVVANAGATDTLLAVSSPVSTDVGLHQTITHGNVGEMVPVASLTVPHGGSLAMAPGGYHVMIENPSALTVGERVPLTLRFAHAGELTVEVPVVPLTALNDDTGAMSMSGSGQ